ncbi:neprilysin-1-like [Rhipicephalus microplus]|uniref:neprilysin-1-like n=1 Tax=Rhipicephalus microplus TaxID=6941 RepID=UPI003F6BAD27
MPSWLSDDVKDAFEQHTVSCRAENMSSFPDVPGMEVAYEALRRKLGKRHVQLSKILTEEKVFFITTCLATCSATPADNIFAGDCNKAVMNFAPFAKAFECPVGSPMNPVNKCSFFD